MKTRALGEPEFIPQNATLMAGESFGKYSASAQDFHGTDTVAARFGIRWEA